MKTHVDVGRAGSIRTVAADFSRFQPKAVRMTMAIVALGCLLFADAPAARAQEPQGVVEGRVFNSATGLALGNARVTLEGANRDAITDESGWFRFQGVPAGEARLGVVYLGLERQAATVVVPAGGKVSREFELTQPRSTGDGTRTVKMDAITVIADREMSTQAMALNERRHAPNIKQVVAIDEFGDRGGENIGEFLRFLPGVSIEASGSEPTQVSLRGFPGSNSNVTVDGADMAAAFLGNNRAIDLREVPMGNVSRVGSNRRDR